jgi:hypothetical protein
MQEYKPRSVGYWVRLRIGSHEDTIVEVPERTQPLTRAA